MKTFGALICLAALLAGCTQQVEPVNVEYRIPVEVEQVEIDNVESIVVATGTLRTVTEAELKTEVPGHFFLNRNADGIPYAEGSVVSKDELIAEILVNEHGSSRDRGRPRLHSKMRGRNFTPKT